MFARRTLLSLSAGIFVALVPASALAVDVRVCLSALNAPGQVWDYSPTMDGRDLREDFGRLDQPGSLAIPGILTAVHLTGSSNRIWGWAPVDAKGCTTQFDAPSGANLEVEVFFWSYNLDTNASVVSLECGNDVDCATGGASMPAVVPPQGGTIPVGVVGTRRSFVHFAAATAEWRIPTATNVTYYTRTGIDLETISNRIVGGHPTANIGGESFRSKFTVAHEVGHLKTLLQLVAQFSNASADYCYGNPNDCTLTWGAESPEWQSAAAIEGFADFFAMLVWNDVEGFPRDGVNASPSSATTWLCRYRPDPSEQGMPALPDDCIPQDSNITAVADSWHHQANCDPMDCPSGVATAWDWAFALWDMQVMRSVPSIELVQLLGLTYPWPVNGEDSDYWDEFIWDIAGPGLAGDDLVAWLEFAHVRGIDR